MKEIKKLSQYNSKKRKILKTTNIDHCWYPKCHRHHLRVCGGVEKAKVVQVEVEVEVEVETELVETMHRTKSRHSASA